MAHALLMVPVPELDQVVRRRLEQCEPEHLPLLADDAAAHIGLLTTVGAREDLTDGVLAELRRDRPLNALRCFRVARAGEHPPHA